MGWGTGGKEEQTRDGIGKAVFSHIRTRKMNTIVILLPKLYLKAFSEKENPPKYMFKPVIFLC